MGSDFASTQEVRMSIFNVPMTQLRVVGRGYFFFEGQLVRCDVNGGRVTLCGGGSK